MRRPTDQNAVAYSDQPIVPNNPEWLGLWDRFRAGEEAAVETVVRKLVPGLKAVARQHSHDEDGASDIVAEVVSTLFRHREKLPQFRTFKELKNYSNRLTRNTATTLNAKRRKLAVGRARDIDGATDVDNQHRFSGTPAADQLVLSTELISALDAALAKLSTRERSVIVGLHVDGRTTAEVASLTGMSPKRVQRIAAGARKRLRALLSATIGDE